MGKNLNSDVNKSRAKVMGVKSAFYNGDKVIMTSFGRGNEAVTEKYIRDDEVRSLKDPAKYNAAKKGAIEITTDHTIPDLNTKNPVMLADPQTERKRGRKGVVGLKDQLEMRYFGKTFDDNIHIQVIHNILDIEKILAQYANNICYSINNIIRSDEDLSRTDLVGDLLSGFRKNYKEFMAQGDAAGEPQNEKEARDREKAGNAIRMFEDFYNSPRIGYYGNAFFKDKGKCKYEIRSKETVYNTLALMSEVRNFITHDVNSNMKNGTMGRSGIYNLDKLDDFGKADMAKTMDELYKEIINELNKSFAQNASKSNLQILFEALGITSDEGKRKTAQKYYGYALLKSYKNEGFSVTSLREQIIDQFHPEVKEDKWDSLRSKLYNILDYLILDYYEKNALGKGKDGISDADALVDQLRTTLVNDRKDEIYEAEAKRVGPKLQSAFGSALTNVWRIEKKGDLSLTEHDQKIVNKAIEDVKLPDSASRFSEMIYVMTLFLSGKEINDLLTTLINKFDNISSLISFMAGEFIECHFVQEYAFFDADNLLREKKKAAAKLMREKAAEEKELDKVYCPVLEELRLVNSIARMSSDVLPTKKEMFKDALLILGCTMSEQEMSDYLDGHVLDKDKVKAAGHIHKKNGKPDMGFRNFIVNNMIGSWRFQYIVRYANPRMARAIGENEVCIRAFLDHVPEAQIDRYYLSCTGKTAADRKTKVDYLVQTLLNIDLKDFERVDHGADAKKNRKKQQAITVMSLYLMVIYQTIKNLVNINSRYVIAFHALERDGGLVFGTSNTKRLSHSNFNYLKLAAKDWNDKDAALQEDKAQRAGKRSDRTKRQRVLDYLKVDLEHSDDFIVVQFRNCVSHLNVVRSVDKYLADVKGFSSYYALYHYLLQRTLRDDYQYNLRQGYIQDGPEGRYYVNRSKDTIRINPFVEKVLEDVEKRSTYNKDLVKALCAPFAYNLARFKDLTVEGLFDMNEIKEKTKTEK